MATRRLIVVEVRSDLVIAHAATSALEEEFHPSQIQDALGAPLSPGINLYALDDGTFWLDPANAGAPA